MQEIDCICATSPCSFIKAYVKSRPVHVVSPKHGGREAETQQADFKFYKRRSEGQKNMFLWLLNMFHGLDVNDSLLRYIIYAKIRMVEAQVSPIIFLILQGIFVFMVIMTLDHILSLDEVLKVSLLSLLIPDNVNAVFYSCNDLKCNDPSLFSNF